MQTIYVGGGTPSVLEPMVLQDLLQTLQPEGPSAKQEITLELNPEDLNFGYVAALQNTWFNRFSLGVQSFSDNDLVYLNRTHSARQACDAVKMLKTALYRNISIDLIYGIPGSSEAQWRSNLALAFSIAPHVSAYALTVEQKTPLAWMIEKKRSAPVIDDLQAGQFNILMQKARAAGFYQYEISNFCSDGLISVHNANYWRGVPYLGLGPSAHSYNGFSRRWNVSNLSEYISKLERGEIIYEEEVLTTSQKYNEYVMTSLRTIWGCNPGKINDELHLANQDLFKNSAAPFIGQGLLTEVSGVYFLTDAGKLFADRIAAALFIE